MGTTPHKQVSLLRSNTIANRPPQSLLQYGTRPHSREAHDQAMEYCLTAESIPNLHITLHPAIADIDAAAWNALSGTDYPFMRHEFLAALEDSGSVGSGTGWRPMHVALREGEKDGPLLAIMPMYLKTDSYGEYVFDWSWADAYQRHGMRYYPKLLTAIPFTPASGPRICFRDPAQADTLLPALVAAVQRQAVRLEVSGWHLLFPDTFLSETLLAAGLRRRTGCQYQWFNRGYRDFEDFLASFNSRKRKNVRKERQRVADAGVSFEWLEGEAITPAHWQTFYHFYASTYHVRGRLPYLNQSFFTRVGASLAEHTLLVLARKDGEIIAGALSFKGKDTLYGRYWGCGEEYQFLHFETCYYQGIDYCLKHGFNRFDSGAQGEHKIQRGFEPVHTWSNHWLAHPSFQAAVSEFLEEEHVHVERYMDRAREHLPFSHRQC